jgi:hypothetical protein
MNKTQETFKKIFRIANDMSVVAGEAMIEEEEKLKEEAMERIIIKSDEIEKLYSSNWH